MSGLEVFFVFVIVEVLEDVFEATIIFLEDGVFGGHVERVVAGQGVFEAGVGEGFNGVVMVEHEQTDSGSWEFVDRDIEVISLSFEVDGDVTGAGDEEVGAVVDVTEGVSADDDGFVPVLDEARDVPDEDRFSEDGAVEVVPDGAIGTLPHLLQFELLDSGFVGGDGRTLDAHLALLDGLGSVQGHLVVRLVSVFDAEVEVLDVEVKVGMDQLVFDILPEDPGHLISV